MGLWALELDREISPITKYQSQVPAFEVVGLGQCALDLLGRVPDYPEVDRKTELTEFLVQGGGPVATALVTLARLGVHTTLFGRVGDDDFGVRIRQELEGEGVDCRNLLIDPGASSQFAFIAVEEITGRRNIFWTRGSARPLSPADIDADLIRGCRILHLDGLQAEASLAAARIARENGVTTILDGGTFREGTRDLMPFIDHLVVSERFAVQLSRNPDPRATLEKMVLQGAQTATVTLGERGSRTLTCRGEDIHQPAFAVAAVDTTGCGDVFHGGYIFGLLRGWQFDRILRFAAACAAIKAQSPGGRTGIPKINEVEMFLKERGF
jgi:sulfofructose kinase